MFFAKSIYKFPLYDDNSQSTNPENTTCDIHKGEIAITPIGEQNSKNSLSNKRDGNQHNHDNLERKLVDKYTEWEKKQKLCEVGAKVEKVELFRCEEIWMMLEINFLGLKHVVIVVITNGYANGDDSNYKILCLHVWFSNYYNSDVLPI